MSSSRVLRHRGKLVVETMHRDRLMRIFQAETVGAATRNGYLLEERQLRARYTSVLRRNTMTYIPDEGPRREFPYELRTYTATELVEMLREGPASRT